MTRPLREDEGALALGALAQTVGLYFTAADPDGQPLALAHPTDAPCLSSLTCPLRVREGSCPGAVAVPWDGLTGERGLLTVCQGAPHRPAPVAAAATLADAFLAQRQASVEMDSAVRELAATYQELGLAYGILETISLPGPREMVARALVSHLCLALGASGALLLSLATDHAPVLLADHGLSDLDRQTLPTALADHAARLAERDAPFDLSLGAHHILGVLSGGDQGSALLIAVCRDRAHPFGSREAKLLIASGRQAALAIRNRALVDELRSLFACTIEALVAAIEAKDPYTCGHSRRVAHTARATGAALGLPDRRLDDLHTAAIVHDVGKIAVDTAILRKTSGGLSEPEWQAVRRHPERGAGIIACVPQLRQIAPAVRHHHERLDSGGYPDGLRQGQIPLEAAIIAVCDSYDAMTSHRPYRLALTPEEARRELRRCCATQFEPSVVVAFLDVRAA